jgi:hypothetical protein
MVAAAAMMTMIEKTSDSLSHIICLHKLVIQQNIKQNSKNDFFIVLHGKKHTWKTNEKYIHCHLETHANKTDSRTSCGQQKVHKIL